MKKRIKKIILVAVIVYGVLVAVNQSIPLIIGKGNCPKPLHVLAQVQAPTTFTPALTQSDFQKVVEMAITEWETKTGVDLFTLVEPTSTLAKSGLSNTITAYPEDLSKFTVGEESQKAGWADVNTRGERVENFKVAIYNTSPVIMYNVVLHELGHARGLAGHSDNPKDIMFPEANYALTNLSDRDVKTMVDYCNGIK